MLAPKNIMVTEMNTKNIMSLYENNKNIMGTIKMKNIMSLYKNEKNIMRKNRKKKQERNSNQARALLGQSSVGTNGPTDRRTKFLIEALARA
jgi:hypothetical protein